MVNAIVKRANYRLGTYAVTSILVAAFIYFSLDMNLTSMISVGIITYLGFVEFFGQTVLDVKFYYVLAAFLNGNYIYQLMDVTGSATILSCILFMIVVPFLTFVALRNKNVCDDNVRKSLGTRLGLVAMLGCGNFIVAISIAISFVMRLVERCFLGIKQDFMPYGFVPFVMVYLTLHQEELLAVIQRIF